MRERGKEPVDPGRMDKKLLVMEEKGIELGVNPLIGLPMDVGRVEAALRIIDERYGKNPQDALARKEALLKDSLAAVREAEARILGLGNKEGIPLDRNELK